jgi:membrane protease YdiL (CAAX protease family)
MNRLIPVLAWVGGVLQDPLDRILQISAERTPEQMWESMVRYMGAGIYEETIFRLLLFSGIRTVFVLGDFPDRWSNVLAAVGSALIFASAHQVGAGHLNATLFLYRATAGLYFAWLFCARGLGIAVGAHAGFDVLVGLVVR